MTIRKIFLFFIISFSSRTITRRKEKMPIDLKICLKDNCKSIHFFSLAADESIGIPDTAHIPEFV